MNNIVLNNAGEYPQLAKSIYYWLNYQKSVSRSDVLLESAIRFPLAEFIERRYKVAIDLEARHPDFDRLRMDFCYKIGELSRNIEVKFYMIIQIGNLNLNVFLMIWFVWLCLMV